MLREAGLVAGFLKLWFWADMRLFLTFYSHFKIIFLVWDHHRGIFHLFFLKS
jgi:hypothetical protein